MESTWETAKRSLKGHLAEHSYRMWIEPLEYRRTENGCLILGCPNFFSKKRILEHYRTLIEQQFDTVNGSALRLQLEVGVREEKSPPAPVQPGLPSMCVRPHSGRLLRRDFTFDHFVVGNNNDFAYSASLALASQSASAQTALFLLSDTGLGKSHLSQAVGHYVLAQNPQQRVYYITAEDFTGEMVDAFRHDNLQRFQNKYRNGCDVLLLEDVHHLGGRERSQTELAFVLDALMEAGKKVIFTSCHIPMKIPKLNAKLRSRLGCGVISSIERPDYRTRRRILQKKAALAGHTLPTEVIEYLAGELTEDIRQLESGLIGVTAKSSLLKVPLDLSLAESVVRNIRRQHRAVTVDTIKTLVCREYRISEKEIVSRSRKRIFVRPRQIAIYLARKYTDASLQAIGRSFNRYHATAIHAVNTVEREIRADGRMRREIDILERKLKDARN